MGLFDEAIREHLELKRRHGADLQEIARIERDALRRADDAAEMEPDLEPHEQGLPLGHDDGQLQWADEPPSWGDEAIVARDDQNAEETTEIDIGARAGERQAGPREETYDHEREGDWAVVSRERSDEFEWEAPRPAGR